MLEGEHLMLDLASGNPEEGEIQPKGYILQDIQPHKGIDLVCDILQLKGFVKPGQCKSIRMSHVLEHFPKAQVVPILKMLLPLLEEGGNLEIHVPNFKWHASLLLLDKDTEAVNYAFGGQRDEYDFHKTAFTPYLLGKALTDAGYKVNDIVIENSIHVIATKDGKS